MQVEFPLQQSGVEAALRAVRIAIAAYFLAMATGLIGAITGIDAYVATMPRDPATGLAAGLAAIAAILTISGVLLRASALTLALYVLSIQFNIGDGSLLGSNFVAILRDGALVGALVMLSTSEVARSAAATSSDVATPVAQPLAEPAAAPDAPGPAASAPAPTHQQPVITPAASPRARISTPRQPNPAHPAQVRKIAVTGSGPHLMALSRKSAVAMAAPDAASTTAILPRRVAPEHIKVANELLEEAVQAGRPGERNSA